MKLYPPIKKARIYGTLAFEIKSVADFRRAVDLNGQRFGVNQHPDPNFYPSFGLKGHNGIDITVFEGEPIYASHDGMVDYVSNDFYSGLGVKIKGDGFKTIYWHNLENKVVVGQEVKVGDVIALGDNTGFSTGNHLH